MTTYFRDFADADGISDWTEDRYATSASWSISSGVLTGGATANLEALTWNDIDADGNRAEVEVYGQFRTNSTTNSTRAMCIVRGNTATGATGSEYYQLALRNTTLRASYKLNGGSLSSISDLSHGFTVAANTWYGYRFRVITDGSVNRIYGRVWDASGSEPGTWLIDGSSVTDSNIMSAGVVGVQKTSVTNTHDWRYFGVGTNGDTAPTSAPSTATAAPPPRRILRMQHLLVR